MHSASQALMLPPCSPRAARGQFRMAYTTAPRSRTSRADFGAHHTLQSTTHFAALTYELHYNPQEEGGKGWGRGRG